MTSVISYLNSSLVLKLFSWFVKILLQAKGVKVGVGFVSRSLPILVKDRDSEIVIGNNVVFKGCVDLRSLKGSNLNLRDDVQLDKDVRIIATNAARVVFDNEADIGCNSIFNCGADVYIGKSVLVAGFCYVQTSNHKIARNQTIKAQGYTHKPITLGDDCWLGGGSFVLPGVVLGKGVVVGANSLVNKSFPEYQIVVGSPAESRGSRD